MAITPNPIVWNFWRKVDDAQNLGGIVHYYDEESQSIFLNGGIETRTAKIPEGHWRESTQRPKLHITDDTFTKLRLDHPDNGVVFGVATEGNKLTFLRYAYGLDISDLMTNWTKGEQIDNSISDFYGDVLNLGKFIFSDMSTLFQPGARIISSIRIGQSNLYPMGVHWLDEANYDQQSDTLGISGRNTIGYFLKDQTFDERTTWTGTRTKIVSDILDYAGVTNYRVEDMPEGSQWIFKPEDTLLEGLEQMVHYYTRGDAMWRLVELPDGMIIVGNDAWVSTWQANTHYSFDEGVDLFKRNTSKIADGSYTRLRVTGTDTEFNELAPIYVPVKNFPYWNMGKHKTNHVKAPGLYTQATLQTWANLQADIYQYVGIGENFGGPFRPQLLVGDIAEVVEGPIGTSLGLITSISQKFSLKSGYTTDFSVDSGGISTDGDNFIIYSRANEANGFNRKQQIIDIIRHVSGKK